MTDLTVLMAAHVAALAAYDALSDEDFDALGAEFSQPLDATRDAILDHRPGTLEEVATKAAFMADTRSFHTWDDFDQVRLIQALTPTPVGTSTIASLIAGFSYVKAARDAALDRGEEDGPDQEALDLIEQSVIRHPCRTIEEVRAKATFFLENESPYDTIRNCRDAKEEALLPFLRSLLGEGCAS